MISPEQIRAARAILDWSTADLAQRSGLTVNGINKIERGQVKPHQTTVDKLQRLFEENGLEFMDYDGVRRLPKDVEIFEGPARFEEFYEFLYRYLERFGGDLCVSVGNEKLFPKYRQDIEAHRKRMFDIKSSGKITARVLATESRFVSDWAEYRIQPEQNTVPTAFYAFGDCLALISFTHKNPPYVVLLKSSPLAASYRAAFNMAWERAEKPGRKA